SAPEVTGYRDLVEIGRGGFARVYRAHQDRFNRAVALKVLDLADPDERTRDRFERECRAMGELSWHPHVVAVYDSGVTEGGHLFLAMEYLERGSLADAAGGGSLDWSAVLTAGIEVCGALGAAHAAGTLHRDLKPENVLVGPFGEARLSDFGIAAVDGGRRTTTGVASFTVAHVAPEVLRGHRQDERTDVYGLASTLFTLLAGDTPFAGEPDEPVAAAMMRVLETPPPRLGEPVPPDLADLLVAGLAKDPDGRPSSAAVFGEALQAVQRGRGLAVTPLRLAASAPAPPPAPVVTPAPPDPEPTVVTPEPTPPPPPPTDLPPPPPEPAAVTTDPAPAADDAATVTLAPAAALADGAHAAGADTGETVTVATPAPQPPASPPPAGEPPPASPTATPAPDPASPPPAAGEKKCRGRVLLVVAAVVVVLALAVGAIVALTGDDGGGDAAGTFETPADFGTPIALALDGEGLWVTDSSETIVYRLDPTTGEQVTETGINNVGTGMALTDDDAGWITGDDTADLIRIDLATNEDTNQVEVGDEQQSISAAGTDVWVTRDRGGTGSVVRLDAVALALAIEIEVGATPNAVAATDDVVWVTNGGDGTVNRIDPDTNEVTATVEVGGPPSAVAAVEDAVWVVSKEARTVVRIDPETNEIVATIELDGEVAPGAIAATTAAVWVVDGAGNQVLHIHPETDDVTDTIAVGDEPVAIAATDTDVWVANAGAGTLTHIDPAAFT
ncbi:MAG TPA: protein kinase, partial [Acidimicrobiales bacterium]|nr:protein kinase [Acidimicrobiales bacterium]